eukprot:9724728-Prorocentrum_lima.AAC.1
MLFKIPGEHQEWYETMMRESQDRLMTSEQILSHEDQAMQPDPSVQFQGSQETVAPLEASGPDHDEWNAAMAMEF